MPHDPLIHRNPDPGVWAVLALTLSLAACTSRQARSQAAQQEAYAQKLAKAKVDGCSSSGFPYGLRSPRYRYSPSKETFMPPHCLLS